MPPRITIFALSIMGLACATPVAAQTTEPLPNGTQVVILEARDGRTKVALPDGREVWVRTRSLVYRGQERRAAEAPEPRDVAPYTSVVWTSGGALNLRAGPSTAFAVLGQCQKGDWVKVQRAAGDWVEVRTMDDALGWVHARFLTR